MCYRCSVPITRKSCGHRAGTGTLPPNSISRILKFRKSDEPLAALRERDAASSLNPFLSDLIQTVCAQLEFLAQTAKNARLARKRFFFKLARDEIGSFALVAIVDEEILPVGGPSLFEHFREDAGPEEREIADVPVDFAGRAPF